jgi:phage portal protein BeeE
MRFWRRRSAPYPVSLQQWVEQFSYGGNAYSFAPQMSMPSEQQEPPERTFDGYVRAAYQQNGVIFACMLVRLLLFSEARFQYRRLRSGRPGELFGDQELGPLEKPWPGGTTGDLLARIEQDSSLAGNAYVVRRGDVLRRLRPDWVGIVTGTPAGGIEHLDVDVVGYMYYPYGPNSREEPVTLLPEQVAHYAPIPDPAARFRGMSWLTPVILELMADTAATTHKLKFFEHAATPNFVLKYDPSLTDAQFSNAVRSFNEKFGEESGSAYLNAYKTLHVRGGADPVPVGTDLRQLDFKATQGAGETRIAAAAGVPPVIVGLSEGLQSATYSNYGQARRRFADGTMRPLWRNVAGSLAVLINVPAGAELWYDDRDIPFLQEDQRDAAEVLQLQATAMKTLVDGGWIPDDIVDAVVAGDLARLKGSHTGMNSVQLQPPGTAAPPPPDGQPPDGQPPASNGQPARQLVEKIAELARTEE